MKTISLRGIDKQLDQALKERAIASSSSVNTTILGVLREGLGLQNEPRRRTYHDLDCLAGTWNSAEKEAFDDAIAPLQQIDEELWQ